MRSKEFREKDFLKKSWRIYGGKVLKPFFDKKIHFTRRIDV